MAWNAGEDFPSLGIGHFIWYPRGVRQTFSESFPGLIRFLTSRRVSVPSIALSQSAPWSSRSEFLRQKNSPAVGQLRSMLAETVGLQSEYLVMRLQGALPQMLRAAPADQQNLLAGRFHAVAATRNGKYALVDYVNFKGEGTNPSERYRGQGWGMLQVLQEMHGTPTGNAAVNEFSAAAGRVLNRRIANAPRKESQWRAGWLSRIATYRY